MRRTARAALVAAALAGVVVGTAPAASADPAAQVTPDTAQPGGSVTVSVTCASTGGAAPATLAAASPAFEERTVQLNRIPDTSGQTSRAAYRGTARVTSAGSAGQDGARTVTGTCPGAAGAKGVPWRATFTVPGEAGGGGRGREKAPGTDPGAGAGAGERAADGYVGGDSGVSGIGGGTGNQGVGGIGGGTGNQGVGGIGGGTGNQGVGGIGGGTGNQGVGGIGGGTGNQGVGGVGGGTGNQGIGGDTGHDGVGGIGGIGGDTQHEGVGGIGGDTGELGAVDAGVGGSFNDSVPALVVGGLLIAGAFGAAVHRLWRRRPDAHG
ncbi:hypothetical protein [Streptomyces sp. NPDC001978]|uniref:hypothetical protein n=1 Tax=Streptomyces sp. NPDC001978 TaxID=3364627 RepID=UPI003682D65B